jgi:hypothetical protein
MTGELPVDEAKQAKDQFISDMAVVLCVHAGQMPKASFERAREFAKLLEDQKLPLPTGLPFLWKTLTTSPSAP